VEKFEAVLGIGYFLFCLIMAPAVSMANSTSPDRLVVADFNSGKKPNNLGQDWGAWNFDPSDPDQGCRDSIEAGALRLDYDVQSSKPAFNGFWMRLGGLDAASYEWLSFQVRGGRDGKFTKRFKVELKNQKGERASYLVQIRSSEWQPIRIPFKKNPAVTDWSRLVEFVVVFDDVLATYKKGTIYLDEIEFQK